MDRWRGNDIRSDLCLSTGLVGRGCDMLDDGLPALLGNVTGPLTERERWRVRRIIECALSAVGVGAALLSIVTCFSTCSGVVLAEIIEALSCCCGVSAEVIDTFNACCGVTLTLSDRLAVLSGDVTALDHCACAPNCGDNDERMAAHTLM